MLGLLELFGWRDIGGLWLVLIGWFLVTAARTEQESEAVRGALAGLAVRDIMLLHADTGAVWMYVADFTDRVALASRQTVFPTRRPGGNLAGSSSPRRWRASLPLRQARGLSGGRISCETISSAAGGHGSDGAPPGRTCALWAGRPGLKGRVTVSAGARHPLGSARDRALPG